MLPRSCIGDQSIKKNKTEGKGNSLDGKEDWKLKLKSLTEVWGD